MTRGFDDRRQFAAKMHQQWLEPAMAAYWRVDRDDIQPMYSQSSDAVVVDEKGGIDAIVQTAGSAPVFVAQRVRKMRKYRNNWYRPDFSLRDETSTGDKSEYARLMDAYRTGRDLPSVYLFGIGAATSQKGCINEGLTALYWIDTKQLVASIDAGDIEGERHQNDTGETTYYYSVDDLQRCDCVRAKASGSALQSVYDDNRCVDAGYPRITPGVRTSRTRLQDFTQTGVCEWRR